MDFTKLMIITGMTMKDLHEIPKKALYNIIKVMEDRLYGSWLPEVQRTDIEYQINCYNKLMLTAK
jgi:hypothetical protein